LLGAHDAHRERLGVLREQEDLLAGVEQAADGEHGVVLADVGIEEDGIAAGIDDGLAAGAGVGGAKGVEHPGRGCNHGIGSGNAADYGIAIPLQPAREARSAALDGLCPTDEIAVRHHDARKVDWEIGVAKLVEVKQVGLNFTHQAGEELGGFGQVLRRFMHPLQVESGGPILEAVEKLHPGSLLGQGNLAEADQRDSDAAGDQACDHSRV
jgi:hypothetical protein